MSLEPLRGGGSSWQSWQRPIRPVVNSMDEARRKIDEYDKGLPRTWAEATLPWAARSIAGELADKRYYLPENNRLYQAIPQRLINAVDTSLTYHDLLGIGRAGIDKPQDMSWKAFLKDKQAYVEYRRAVYENFEHFKLPAISPLKYLKHLVLQYNLARFVDDLQQGRIFPFVARGLGLGFFGWQIVRNTRKAFLEAKTKEDGSFKSRFNTCWQTVKAGAIETGKAAVAWELGTLGFVIGSALFCVGTIPAIIAGCVAGGLLEAGFRSLVTSQESSGRSA